MKFKAVLFDLDGTLLDTIDDLSDSANAVLAASGFPTHKTEAYKYFVGDGVRELIARALPESHRDKVTIESSLAAMRLEYRMRWADKTRPYKGIPQLLDALVENNIKMAILSNKADEFTQLIVKKLLPGWKFEAVFGESPAIPKKPDPAGAFKISDLLGIPAGEFLYLGDTNVDMKTAVLAGMYPVGALWGFRKPDELVEGGARVLIPIPEALLDLL
ncbi:MAG: HAD family hydrolase [Ruminiclostridium sp.]|nr:HAD family hydrolase [Ruminiclostridium sp.]